MTVYVDDMRAPFGRLIMCHMIATDDFELHQMAEVIGVARKWHQAPPKALHSHYDIALSKRRLAVEQGAVQITERQAMAMVKRRRVEGDMGRPDEALGWYRQYRDARRQGSAPVDGVSES